MSHHWGGISVTLSLIIGFKTSHCIRIVFELNHDCALILQQFNILLFSSFIGSRSGSRLIFKWKMLIALSCNAWMHALDEETKALHKKRQLILLIMAKSHWFIPVKVQLYYLLLAIMICSHLRFCQFVVFRSSAFIWTSSAISVALEKCMQIGETLPWIVWNESRGKEREKREKRSTGSPNVPKMPRCRGRWNCRR